MPDGSGIIVACNLACPLLHPKNGEAKVDSYSCWYKYMPYYLTETLKSMAIQVHELTLLIESGQPKPTESQPYTRSPDCDQLRQLLTKP